MGPSFDGLLHRPGVHVLDVVRLNKYLYDGEM